MELKQVAEILYWMRCVTGSQCRVWRKRCMWSDFLALHTSLAAAFWTFWSLSSKYWGHWDAQEGTWTSLGDFFIYFSLSKSRVLRGREAVVFIATVVSVMKINNTTFRDRLPQSNMNYHIQMWVTTFWHELPHSDTSYHIQTWVTTFRHQLPHSDMSYHIQTLSYHIHNQLPHSNNSYHILTGVTTFRHRLSQSDVSHHIQTSVTTFRRQLSYSDKGYHIHTLVTTFRLTRNLGAYPTAPYLRVVNGSFCNEKKAVTLRWSHSNAEHEGQKRRNKCATSLHTHQSHKTHCA